MKTRNKMITAGVLIAAIGGTIVAGLSVAHDRGNNWRSYWSHDGDYDGHHGRKHDREHNRKYSRKHDRDGSRGQDRRQGQRKLQQLLQRFDSNGDGRLTQAEIDQVQTGRLNAFDNDQNGQLDLDEYAAQWLDSKRSRMVDQFQALDNDGDAVVTAEEFTAPIARLAERLNLDATDDEQEENRQAPTSRE